MKKAFFQFFYPFHQAETFLPIAALLTGALILVPLPGVILDFLLGLSFVLSLIIFLISLYVERPLDFAIFPTVLLFSTIFRLALGLATTRAILLSGGGQDPHQMSRLIQGMGAVVISDNFLVGIILFTILMIINFVVITKGSNRIAEVAARFTLDALPGKQMAIDAELNSGQITAEEARSRRKEIEKEADFYGAMDGASKFVRGDAIATILIAVVNILIGFLNGVLAHGYSFLEAARTFTLLAAGDGLLSALPALLVSMAAGLIITRASSQGFLTKQLIQQGIQFPKIFYICAILTLTIPFLKGFPKIPFWILTLGLVFVGRWSEKQKITQKTAESQTDPLQQEEEKREADLKEALHIDPIAVEVGHGLVNLIDPSQNGELIGRARALRTQIAHELGLIIPPISLRDNLKLKSHEYEISLRGNLMAKGTLKPHQVMALDPGNVSDPLEGEPTREPVYGMDAIWVSEEEKQMALVRGYLVVNLPTIITTHLSKIVKMNAKDLISRSDLKQRLDEIQEQSPKLMDEVIHSERLTLGDVLKVLQNLLSEEVSIKDLSSILNSLADHSRWTKNPDLLAEQCRLSLGRSLVQPYLAPEGQLYVTSFERAIEDQLRQQLQRTDQGTPYLKLEPGFAKDLIEKLSQVIPKFDDVASSPVLILSTALRLAWKQILANYLPQYTVLAFDEIPRNTNLQVLHLIQ